MKNLTKHLLVLTLLFFYSTNGNMEGFIVGGKAAEIKEYPHSVFLKGRCESGGQWICGASILNQRIILTAAHCLIDCDSTSDDQINHVVAFAGHADLRQVTIKRLITDVRIHQGFSTKSLENDIAVAKVRREFPLGDTVKRIIITPEFPSGFNFGYISGWGIIKEASQTTSMILKHVQQKVGLPETCALIGELHEGMFCAGSTELVDHPAGGDSGSALVTTSRFHQVGLVSFGIERHPALMVYSNTSYYYQWIHYNAKDLYCDES